VGERSAHVSLRKSLGQIECFFVFFEYSALIVPVPTWLSMSVIRARDNRPTRESVPCNTQMPCLLKLSRFRARVSPAVT